MKTTLTLNQIPSPDVSLSFSLNKLETVGMPHPYCITPRHVAVASDRFGGRLGEEAIKYAEKNGVYCDICKKNKGEILPYEKHEQLLTLFLNCPKAFKNNLNNIPGLYAYLLMIKEKNLGIDGFAFLFV